MINHNMPDEMRMYKNWVAWRLETVGGRETKIPYSPMTGCKAKSNDASTWSSLRRAAARVEEGGYSGVGFMLSGSPYVCVDLDDCLDGGEKEAWAAGIVAALDSYTEVSQSGRGLHIFGRANIERGRKNDRIEVYPDKRFIAMTGNIYEGRSEIHDMQAALDALMREHFPGDTGAAVKAPPAASKTRATGGSSRTDASNSPPAAAPEHLPPAARQAIERARKKDSAPLFARLFDEGDTSGYASESEADLALMNLLAFAADGDVDVMEQVFSASALGKREKWQKRADYRAWTVKAARAGWVENRLVFLPMTDADNARRLCFLHGENLKYLPEKGNGAAWMRWNGKRWKAVHEYGLYDYVVDTAEHCLKLVRRLAEESAESSLSTDLQKPLAALMKLKNRGKMDDCLKVARKFLEASITDFDRSPYMLNVQNGVIDLKTGKLHKHRRSLMCSRIARAEYRPALMGKESLWADTIAQIVPDEEERAYLQKWAGYLLIGAAPEEKLLFLYGTGGSGKGTFINTIGHMMGDYADTVDIEVFLASRNDGHGGGANASPEIAKLAGTRAAMASESGIGRKLNDAKVKNMTGRDDLTARFLYGQQFTFSPVVKFVLSSNYLPTVHDSTDEGLLRRLVIAPFMQDLTSVRDMHLKERLKQPDELAAVLAWCVEGCLMWQQADGLGTPPRRFLQQAGAFYADSDTLQQFIDDECFIGERCRVKVKDFHDAFVRWCGEKVKRKTILDMMRRKGYEVHRYNTGRFFDGMEIKVEFPFLG